MPAVEFFVQNGLFARRKFLDGEICHEICRQIERAKQFQTPVPDITNPTDATTNFEGRPKVALAISDLYQKYLSERLFELTPELKAHFQTDLNSMKEPYYAIYKTGDRLGLHADSVGNGKTPGVSHERKVSVVIFLNEESAFPKPEAYSGGHLTFYNLIKNETFGKLGMPLNAEKGLLIAFPSTMRHEVSQITSGVRFVVNAGFY